MGFLIISIKQGFEAKKYNFAQMDHYIILIVITY